MKVQEVYDILKLHPYFKKLSSEKRISVLNIALSNFEGNIWGYNTEVDESIVEEKITEAAGRDFSADSYWGGSTRTIAGTCNFIGAYSSIIKGGILVEGNNYILTFTVNSGLGSFQIFYSPSVVVRSISAGVGTKKVLFTALSSEFALRTIGAGAVIDNISIMDEFSNRVSFHPVYYNNKTITGRNVDLGYSLSDTAKIFILNLALIKLKKQKSAKYTLSNVETLAWIPTLVHSGRKYISDREASGEFYLQSEVQFRISDNSTAVIRRVSNESMGAEGNFVRIDKSYYLTLQNAVNSSIAASRIEKLLEGVLGCTLSWRYGLKKEYWLNLNGNVNYINRQATKESDLSLSASVNWRIYGEPQFTEENNLSLGSTINWIISAV